AAAASAHRMSMWQVLRTNKSIYATLGVAVLGIGAVRGARQGALPLWTEHLGFDASATALIFGISGAIDMAMFYPAGKVMDAFGRLWVAIPSMLIMGAAMLALPLTTSFAAVTAVALVLGFGNGIGSGILMTLAADAAPEGGRSQFLGIWRLFADAGNSGGPLIVAGGAALGSLAAGMIAIGVVSVGSVAALGTWVPRWRGRFPAAHPQVKTHLEDGAVLLTSSDGTVARFTGWFPVQEISSEDDARTQLTVVPREIAIVLLRRGGYAIGLAHVGEN